MELYLNSPSTSSWRGAFLSTGCLDDVYLVKNRDFTLLYVEQVTAFIWGFKLRQNLHAVLIPVSPS